MSLLRRLGVIYLGTLLAMLVPDMIWLSTTSAPIYRPALGSHLAAAPDLLAALLFYLLYVLGLVVLAVRPLEAGSIAGAAGRGALFGLVAYATYDLTNQATLAGWPWWLTGIDLSWGTILSATVSAIGMVIARRFHSPR